MMKKGLILFICFLSAGFLGVSDGNSQSLIQLSDKIVNYNIQDNVEVLPDSLGKLKIAQISSPKYASKFQKGYDKNIWLANTKLKAHWLKFTVKNESNQNRWLIRIRGNKVTLFDQQVNGRFKTYQVGDMIPMADWFFKKAFVNDYILPLLIDIGEEKVFYCHIETIDARALLNGSVSAQNIMQIHNEKLSILNEYKFINDVRNLTMIDTIIIGGLLIMLFYHLILTFILKDKVYLYYVLYNFFLITTLMVWKGWIDIFELYKLPIEDRTQLFLIAIFSTVFFYTLFVTNYLNLKKFRPRINVFIKYYLCIIAAIIISLILKFQIPNSIKDLFAINHVLLTFTLLIVAFSIWNKNPLTKVFLLGDSFFILSFTLSPLSFVLFKLFKLSILSLDYSGIQIIDIGAYMQQIIFAYSLALRIQLSNKEKTKAQAETIKIQQEANQQLELKVQERTQELYETNEELQISMEQIHIKNQELFETLEELKSTQSQLVQAEKMASLGQLTAGIAHEINNPINYVYAGVDSLKLNIDDLKAVLEKAEELIPEQKAAELEDFKEDIDFLEVLKDLDTLTASIKNGAHRTKEIVKGLRTFSRLDEDALKETDIHENLDSTLLLLQNQIKDRISIEKHYGNIPPIKAYPGPLNQVFMNILANAIQAIEGEGKITITTGLVHSPQNAVHSPQNAVHSPQSIDDSKNPEIVHSPQSIDDSKNPEIVHSPQSIDHSKNPGTVHSPQSIDHSKNPMDYGLSTMDSKELSTMDSKELSTMDSKNNIFISIQDSGKGMSKSVMERIFEPFFTTKDVGKGTGLGLSISHSIIEKHGGKIEVQSTPGLGTEFRIILPIEPKKEIITMSI